MAEETDGVKDRLTRQGEEAVGKIAQDLLENPLVNAAIARVFDAREKAAQAQVAAMGALNIPSAADIERLTRRVRSVSQRLEGIEDGVDRLDERLAALQGTDGLERRLAAIEERLAEIVERLSSDDSPQASRHQERLSVPAEELAKSRQRRLPEALLGLTQRLVPDPPPPAGQHVGDRQQAAGRQAAPRGGGKARRALSRAPPRPRRGPAGLPAAVRLVEEVCRDHQPRVVAREPRGEP